MSLTKRIITHHITDHVAIQGTDAEVAEDMAQIAAWGVVAEYRPTCRKCAGEMRPGIAIGQTFSAGLPDDLGGDVQTMSAGGPGVVIDCWKCADCGWSVTEPAATESGEVERLRRNNAKLHDTIDKIFEEGAKLLTRAEAAEARLAEGPKVKPLVWGKWRAETPFGPYHVIEEANDDEPFWFVIFNGKAASRCGTHGDEASAKAAAQADYERRILAALESSIE